jgi:hypothetical protein
MSAPPAVDLTAYLADVKFFLSDAVSEFMAANAQDPLDFLAAYFANVQSGKHVLFRKFKFISASVLNRRSFIAQLKNTFRSIAAAPDCEMRPEVLHQLVCLLCPDFPFSLVRNASRICHKNGHDLRYDDFCDRLCILFYFSEFMNQSALAFTALDTKAEGKVNATALLEKLHGVVEDAKLKINCPEAYVVDAAVSQILEQAVNSQHEPSLSGGAAADPSSSVSQVKVTFNEFCVALFKQPRMRQHFNMMVSTE